MKRSKSLNTLRDKDDKELDKINKNMELTPVYVRDDRIITFKNKNIKHIKWLTISSESMTINNLITCCKIQQTAMSKTTYNNCVFYVKEYKTCAIEIFAHSEATFNDCTFYTFSLTKVFNNKFISSLYGTNQYLNDNAKACVVIRDKSKATFNNCLFYCNNATILCIDDSTIEVNNCLFTALSYGKSKQCIYCYKNTTCIVNNSSFIKQHKYTQTIFCMMKCNITLVNILIKNSNTGVMLCEYSKLTMKRSLLTELETGIGLKDSSSAEIDHLNAYNINNQFVNSEDSTCIINDSIIDECKYRFMCCGLPGALLKLNNTIISNINIGIRALICSKVILNNCEINNCKNYFIDARSNSYVELNNCSNILFKSLDATILFNPIEHNEKRIEMRNTHKKNHYCMNCSKILDEIYIISNCGHLLCKDCSTLKYNECKICKSQVTRVIQVYEEEYCSICLDEETTTVLIPCGHCCACNECIYTMYKTKKCCPVCNVKFHQIYTL